MGLIFLILFWLVFLIIYTRLGSGNNIDSTNMITKLKQKFYHGSKIESLWINHSHCVICAVAGFVLGAIIL